MNSRPLYENLDTAFVNLSALVKYLRRREFIGRLRVELNSYEADIVLYEGNKISVREHDKISGRVGDGEQAFQRLIIRAREAGGTIHVYQTIKQAEAPKKAEVVKTENKTVPPAPAKNLSENPPPIPKPLEAVEVAKAAAAVPKNGSLPKPVAVEVPKKPTIANQPKFPFDLHNNVESKARQIQLSAQDWQTLLGLTGELLGAIDKSLAEAKLDFKSAYSKARAEISDDYPFLNPSVSIFEYQAGKIVMHEQVNAKFFVTGVIESLRRILNKLGANPKFAIVYRDTTQRILALINQRQAFYEKFSVALPLKKILGV